MKSKINNEREVITKQLCDQFIHSHRPRYILGRNEFATSVASLIDVKGFIDEYTDEKTFLNKPIINKLENVEKDSIVLSCNVWGRPLTVRTKLSENAIENIDYFTFLKFSGLPIRNIEYWNGFELNYSKHIDQYEKLSSDLIDTVSKHTLKSIIDFRMSYDLKNMDGFEDIQFRQYFEDFLDLQPNGEVFVDVGGFDGYTSKEFIKRCPNFNKIFFLEPDSKNLQKAKDLLSDFSNIEFLEVGASNKKETLRFENELGSSSKVAENGTIIIEANSLDNIIDERVTYIKMDIEGSESIAIEGATQTILKYHPRLAICVYHKANDLITIPEQVLAIRSDYDIYLRHYTESVVETVMYFIPK